MKELSGSGLLKMPSKKKKEKAAPPSVDEEEALTTSTVDHSYLKDDTLKQTEKWGGLVTLYYTSDKQEKGLQGKVSLHQFIIFHQK